MSSTNGNGKPAKRPRTASHEPANGEADGKPSGAGDRSAGRTDAQAGTVRTDGPYGGVARNEHGHFGRGNKAAAGNGNARRMQEYRRQFLEAINPATIPALARKLQVDAIKGDYDALRILLDYTLGKPSQAVELSGPDGEALGVNFHQVTAIVLEALADDPARRIEVAAKLMRLDEARDDDVDA
jgi:hypothetical protein